MIQINNVGYKLCLFDTNALSSFLQNEEQWITYYDRVFGIGQTIICYSSFTIAELYFRRELFDKFIEIFSVFPSVVIDGYEGIFEKELQGYDSNLPVNVIALAPFTVHEPNMTKSEALKVALENSDFKKKAELWREGRSEIIDGMIDLKKNYQPKGKNYTLSEIENFVFMTSITQIGLRSREFARRVLKTKEVINLDKFASIKAMSYVLFYKFYTDQRKALKSDVFDIIISSAFPYVDFCITEGNLCEILKRIQVRHSYLMDLKFYSLKDVQRLL